MTKLNKNFFCCNLWVLKIFLWYFSLVSYIKFFRKDLFQIRDIWLWTCAMLICVNLHESRFWLPPHLQDAHKKYQNKYHYPFAFPEPYSYLVTTQVLFLKQKIFYAYSVTLTLKVLTNFAKHICTQESSHFSKLYCTNFQLDLY